MVPLKQSVKLYYENKKNGDNYFEVKDSLKTLLYTIKFTKDKAELIEVTNPIPLLSINFSGHPAESQQKLYIYIREKADNRIFSLSVNNPYSLMLVEYSNFSEVEKYYCGKIKNTWGVTKFDKTFICSLKHGVSETKFGTLTLPGLFDEFKNKVLIFSFTFLIHCIKSYEASLVRPIKPGEESKFSAFWAWMAEGYSINNTK